MISRRALFAAAAIAAPLFAEKDLTALQIAVTDLNGKPVDRASVVVKFQSGRSVKKLGRKVRTNWELRTNQQGVAKIPPIPQGRILIQVIAKGFQTYGQTHNIDEEEKTVEVKLNPPQPQFSAHQ
jgi:hypothetical protein